MCEDDTTTIQISTSGRPSTWLTKADGVASAGPGGDAEVET